jgi:hypothetical protein
VFSFGFTASEKRQYPSSVSDEEEAIITYRKGRGWVMCSSFTWFRTRSGVKFRERVKNIGVSKSGEVLYRFRDTLFINVIIIIIINIIIIDQIWGFRDGFNRLSSLNALINI